MDQVKIGNFLRTLRKEKGLTQEQLAEQFRVTGRTVSRWETGRNMPDIGILVELAEFYDVDIREIIDGERKSEDMDEEVKDTLVKVAEYTDAEKEKILASLLVSVVEAATAFLFLFIAPALNIIFGLKIDSDTVSYVALLGFALMLGSIINCLQITGNMTKNRMKKIRRTGVTICIAVLIIAIFTVLILVGAMFA